MKKALFILLVLASGIIIAQEELSDNIKKYRSGWGWFSKSCGDLSSTSYTVHLRNTGKETLDVRIAVQEKNKTWKVFNFKHMNPNDTMVAYACNGTGKFLKWARKTGDANTVFPTEEEINRENKE